MTYDSNQNVKKCLLSSQFVNPTAQRTALSAALDEHKTCQLNFDDS